MFSCVDGLYRRRSCSVLGASAHSLQRPNLRPPSSENSHHVSANVLPLFRPRGASRPGPFENRAREGANVAVTEQGDRDLVNRFLDRRDERSFVTLHRRHTPFLLAMAWRLSGGPDDAAEELVESAWSRALSGLAQFEWKSSFRTWITGILVNCHREMLRLSQKSVSLDQVDETAVAPVSIELKIDLERALAKLADGFREVVVLYHIYGYRHHDIADMLGITEATSRSQLTRGLRRLRTILQ